MIATDKEVPWEPMAYVVRGRGGVPEAHSLDIQVEKPLQSREALGQNEHCIQGQAVLTEAGESQG